MIHEQAIRRGVGLILGLASAATGAPTEQRVFGFRQAEAAQRIAQRECVPLAIHIVPNLRIGGGQLSAYYGPLGAVPESVLKRVVVVVLPRDKYARFAVQLGILDAGGLRTISPYSLDILDVKSATTSRAGFI